MLLLPSHNCVLCGRLRVFCFERGGKEVGRIRGWGHSPLLPLYSPYSLLLQTNIHYTTLRCPIAQLIHNTLPALYTMYI